MRVEYDEGPVKAISGGNPLDIHALHLLLFEQPTEEDLKAIGEEYLSSESEDSRR